MPPPSGSTVYEPTGYVPGSAVNLLLACHSAGRTSTDPFGTEGNACIASAQAAGYLVAAANAQGDAWGNAASIADYQALIAYCEATYNVQGIMLWGSSMGGLAALTLSGYQRNAKVRGALLVQAVCDLDATYHDHPAFAPSINAAYGMGSWNAGTVGNYDPIDRPNAEYAGLRFRFYASAGDTYVSKALNSDAMAAKVSAVAYESDVVAVTGDHGDPSHWNWASFEPFIERVFASVPSTPASVRQEAFINNAKLDSVTGLSFRVGRPTKSPSNPVFTPPANTYQHHVVYVSTVKDPVTGQIRLYYGNKTESWGHGRMSLALSDGNDGVTFTRPNLGLFTLDGNTDNSCVIDSSPTDPGTNHNDFPFVNYYDDIGYVALGSHFPYPEDVPGHWYAGIWISSDGVNFDLVDRIDTNVVTRDAIGPIVRRPDGRWVVFMQSRTGANVRSVGYWLSDGTDLRNTTWSAPVDFMLTGPSLTYQYYEFGAWREGEITYAAVLIYDGTGYYQTTPPYFITTNTQDRQFKFELWATSNPDCITGWTRLDADWMWSGANAGALDTTPGEWDYGCMIGGGVPVRVGNDWRYYYGGGREQHHPAPPGPNGTQPWTQREAGFASIPYRRIGGLTGTGNVVLSAVSGATGKVLTINSAGTVKVELLDATTGSVLSGYSQAACDTIPSNTYEHTVTWGGSSSLPSAFKAKVYATSGTVYYLSVDSPTGGSLSVRADPYWAQNGTDLTVFAPIGVPTVATCDIVTTAGGYARVAGPDSAKFSLSSDGSTWLPALSVPAGPSTIFLRAVSAPGDTTLTAQVGIPV